MKHEERIDEINKGTPTRIDLISAIALAVILLLVIFLIGFWTINRVADDQRPEILILSERFVEGYDGEMLLFVDYSVGGISTNATFREEQMEKYYKLIQMLERTGRLNR